MKPLLTSIGERFCSLTAIDEQYHYPRSCSEVNFNKNFYK